MNTYKNIHFTKRDYEATNIVACQAMEVPNQNYAPCDESVIESLTHIYTENGVRFYGYL